VLERLATESAGQFLLVKVDVDQQPGIAQAFGVRSIPHVFALRNGQLVDQFTGALPEDQIRQWLAQFQPSPAELLVQEARKLEPEDVAAAEAKFREALELDPKDDRIRIELARMLLKQHRNADSREIITKLEARGFLEPEAESIKAELDLRLAAAEAGGVGECRAALAANPDDPRAKLKLAEALGAAQQFQEALELGLAVVQSTTGDLRDEARTTMVNLFLLLGPEAELTKTYRRKLATALY
jgi:putative thioredoxin